MDGDEGSDLDESDNSCGGGSIAIGSDRDGEGVGVFK